MTNRKNIIQKIMFVLLVFFMFSTISVADGKKIEGDLSIMVLGSGGPVATAAGRASAGYLIFAGGEPRILMDVGGGTFQRLAKSGVNIHALDRVLLSHLHIDHTGDLSSMIKTIYFHNNMARSSNPNIPGRTAPVHIYGPDSSSFPDAPGGKFPGTDVLQYPSTMDYAHQHYSILGGGVERYLHAFAPAISQHASKFSYVPHNLSSDWQNANIEEVFEKDGLKVTSIAVNHGPVPAVAFRIDYKGHSIVYSGDTSSKTNNVAALAEGVDLLIYDTAITETLPGNPVFHALHTKPKRIGEIAAQAKVKTVLLSHITPVTESRLKEVKADVRNAGFRGKIKIAKDLKVYNLGDD